MGRLDYEPGASLAYDYVGSALIAERDVSNDAILRPYVYGPNPDEPLIWYEGSGTGDKRYLHADERGSVIAVSDGSGQPIAINSYDEYGIPGSANLGRFQYTGQALSRLDNGGRQARGPPAGNSGDTILNRRERRMC